MKTFLEMAQEMQNELVSIRRDFHQHPELSWKEYETTKRIKEYLTSWGIEVIPWGGDTGVIGLLKGAEDGPVVALRGDIDALPVTEETGESFASVNEGCMHACGHDGHATWLIGAAKILASVREEWGDVSNLHSSQVKKSEEEPWSWWKKIMYWIIRR